MNHLERTTKERHAIIATIIGNTVLAILGIGFAFYINSNAVMVDGLYSLTDAMVGMLGLRVAYLILQGETEKNPFGFAMYEPLLNLAKGLLVLFVIVFALITSVHGIIDGGQELHTKLAIIYGLLSSLACLAVYVVVKRQAKLTKSPILRIDAKQWMIDGTISASIGISFVIALILEQNGFPIAARYADSVIVLIMVLIMLPIPASIVRENWNQIVGKSVQESQKEEVVTILDRMMHKEAIQDYRLRMIRRGRMLDIQVYVVTSTLSIHAQDRLRHTFDQELGRVYRHFSFDMIFTNEPLWIERSVGNHAI